MKYSEAGKGSAPRKNADQETYAQNHEKIFGAVGPLARKKQEEALKKLVELSEELKLYSEFDYVYKEVIDKQYTVAYNRDMMTTKPPTEISVTLFVGDEKVVTSYPYSMATAAFDLFKQYTEDGKKATIHSY